MKLITFPKLEGVAVRENVFKMALHDAVPFEALRSLSRTVFNFSIVSLSEYSSGGIVLKRN